MKKISNEALGRKSVPEFKSSLKMPVTVVLDNVRSLHNVGSVFRTCDAFSCEAIYLCGITAKPPHREIEKTALGATESVEWKYFEKTADAVAELKKKDYKIIVVEQADKKTFLNEFVAREEEKYAVVFGHEMSGVSEEVMALADLALEVPQHGTKHSLNISVCAGVVLWEFFKQWNK